MDLHPATPNAPEAQVLGNPKWNHILLYGTLDVWIYEAAHLPNMDSFSEGLRQCLVTACQPCIKVIPNADQSQVYKGITSDPYVCVVLQDATVARTRVIPNTPAPKWDAHFVIPVAHTVAEVDLVIKDNDVLGAQFIGQVKIQAELLLSEKIENRTYDLLGKDGKRLSAGAQLRLSMKYCAVEEDPLYKDGMGAGPDYKGVPNTYFPLHKGGRVTLYQDAHVPDNLLPDIQLKGGIKFQHGKCWEDIYQAIEEAHHLVYIAGWSIHTKTKLVRNEDKGRSGTSHTNLGELLRQKAQYEPARVLLLVWDDKTSHSFIKNRGVMGTHDEETKRFFKHSGVHCLLAPRYADKKVSWFKQKVVGTLYTHHQKLVIVDTQGPGNTRRLVAFLGGLDLCDGRYDTPEHPIFKDLNTTFADDYHNPTFPKVECGGPRQPWHDLHCKIEGPAAYDVLKNFEQRWRKAAKWHGFGLMCRKGLHWSNHVLIDLERVPWIISPDNKEGQNGKDINVMKESDPETWHVQIFRSIDSGSAKGLPKSVEEIEKANLVGGKNIAIDESIHTAYIKAIRSAQHFIYIENQYFLGSSFAWQEYKDAGANHLVPIELALKIVSKIKAKEQFAVYVVIPMFPEGVPTSPSVQEILFFQSQTMQMMYTLIADALKKTGLENEHHPTDFLNFFCLGNREVKGENEPAPAIPPEEKSIQAQVHKTRRFMIYVHAKGMIVDDEYVILGSANINQRSMAGSRDTEIAMGAYQPHRSWARNIKRSPPQGQVYGYRRSLWAEHLCVEEDCFKKPWSLECVKKVQSLAKENWMRYTAEEVTDLKGHLLLYPVEVDSSGKVVSLKDCESFPDVGGKILGSKSMSLPDSLTS